MNYRSVSISPALLRFPCGNRNRGLAALLSVLVSILTVAGCVPLRTSDRATRPPSNASAQTSGPQTTGSARHPESQQPLPASQATTGERGNTANPQGLRNAPQAGSGAPDAEAENRPSFLQRVLGSIPGLVTSADDDQIGEAASVYNPTLETVADQPELIPPMVPQSAPPETSSPSLSSSSLSGSPLSGSRSALSQTAEARPAEELSLQSISSYRIHEGEINALAVTRDGLGVITGGNDGRVIFSTFITSDLQSKQGERGSPASAGATRSLKRTVLLKGSKPVLSLQVSHNGRFLAIGQFSSVLVLDLQKRALVAQMTQLVGRVLALEWDPRDQLLAIGQAGGEVSIWTLHGTASAGANSLKAIETYSSAEGSPVQRLLFHPLGRVLFVGYRNGRVKAHRLLRTEYELGLRDSGAVSDQDRRGSKESIIGQTPDPLEEMWLDPGATTISAADSHGRITRWELRGLEALPPFAIGAENSTSLVPISLPTSQPPGSAASVGATRLLASSGRAQRLRFWCLPHTLAIREIGDTEAVPIFRDTPADTGGETAPFEIINGQVVSAPLKSPPLAAAHPPAAGSPGVSGEKLEPSLQLAAETTILQDPVSLMQTSRTGAVLWGVQKKGKLLAFDSRSLLERVTRSGRCQGEP